MANGSVPYLVGSDKIGLGLSRVSLEKPGEGVFDEAWLQHLIHSYPDLLPIGELEPALDPFQSICREMPIKSGSIDNLLITGRGDIALVEAKLFRNPQSRREVLAQALDYATSLFAMGYESFEKAALAGQFGPGQTKPLSLYLALPEQVEKLPEAAFVDAVSKNLRRGRVLILIVGDGIREEAEALLEGMNTYSRFSFTLAMIELRVFTMADRPGQHLVMPSVLAKTSIIRRTIVEVTNSGSVVVKDIDLTVPETMSTNSYWDDLAAKTKLPGARAALEKLLGDVEPLGVYPDFMSTLNIRWTRPNQKPVILANIKRDGGINMYNCFLYVPREIAVKYVEELADIFQCDIFTMNSPKKEITLYRNGKMLKLASVINLLDAWVTAMQRFIAAILAYDEQAA